MDDEVSSIKKDRSELNIYRLLRLAKGFSITEMAEKLEVTRAYISSIENGKRLPSDELKKRYADKLGVSMDLLDTFEFPKDKTSPTFFEKSLLKILFHLVPNEW